MTKCPQSDTGHAHGHRDPSSALTCLTVLWRLLNYGAPLFGQRLVRSSMRILWLSHMIPYPPKAGVLLRSYYLLKAVAAKHSVDLFSFVQEQWLTTLFDSHEAGLRESREALEAICERVVFTPIEGMQRTLGKQRTALASLFSRDPYMVRWLNGPAARAALAELADARSYDLVHLDTVCLAPFRSAVPQAVHVLNHHNIESHMLLRRAENERNAVKSWYFRQEGQRLERYERELSGAVALNVTCSALDSERLRVIQPAARTAEIPNGVDVDFFKSAGATERPNSLIFVGTMNWYPNVDAVMWLLRDIFPRIRAQCPTATLDIVGANAPESVTSLARQTPGVMLHGFVPEVRPLLDSAALYVCPIRDGGGTKLKVLDAFAMQKCLLAHPVALEGIAARDGVEVATADSAEAFAARALALLADAPTRQRIGSAARELAVRQYSFASIGSDLARLYEELPQRAR
jgi:polysaccharide biosynthesis protein PslH